MTNTSPAGPQRQLLMDLEAAANGVADPDLDSPRGIAGWEWVAIVLLVLVALFVALLAHKP